MPNSLDFLSPEIKKMTSRASVLQNFQDPIGKKLDLQEKCVLNKIRFASK